jgi:hypothetical protein
MGPVGLAIPAAAGTLAAATAFAHDPELSHFITACPCSVVAGPLHDHLPGAAMRCNIVQCTLAIERAVGALRSGWAEEEEETDGSETGANEGVNADGNANENGVETEVDGWPAALRRDAGLAVLADAAAFLESSSSLSSAAQPSASSSGAQHALHTSHGIVLCQRCNECYATVECRQCGEDESASSSTPLSAAAAKTNDADASHDALNGDSARSRHRSSSSGRSGGRGARLMCAACDELAHTPLVADPSKPHSAKPQQHQSQSQSQSRPKQGRGPELSHMRLPFRSFALARGDAVSVQPQKKKRSTKTNSADSNDKNATVGSASATGTIVTTTGTTATAVSFGGMQNDCALDILSTRRLDLETDSNFDWDTSGVPKTLQQAVPSLVNELMLRQVRHCSRFVSTCGSVRAWMLRARCHCASCSIVSPRGKTQYSCSISIDRRFVAHYSYADSGFSSARPALGARRLRRRPFVAAARQPRLLDQCHLCAHRSVHVDRVSGALQVWLPWGRGCS